MNHISVYKQILLLINMEKFKKFIAGSLICSQIAVSCFAGNLENTGLENRVSKTKIESRVEDNLSSDILSGYLTLPNKKNSENKKTSKINNKLIRFDSNGMISHYDKHPVIFNKEEKIRFINGLPVHYNEDRKLKNINGKPVAYNKEGKMRYVNNHPVLYGNEGKLSFINGRPVLYDKKNRISHINGIKINYNGFDSNKNLNNIITTFSILSPDILYNKKVKPGQDSSYVLIKNPLPMFFVRSIVDLLD